MPDIYKNFKNLQEQLQDIFCSTEIRFLRKLVTQKDVHESKIIQLIVFRHFKATLHSKSF